MPLQFPHSPFSRPSVRKGWTRAGGCIGTLIPAKTLLAVSSMSVPDGFGARQIAPYGADRQAARSGRRTRRRAAVLDHDWNVLEVLGELLGEEDYDVTLSTEFLAEDEVIRLDPDVVITDAAFNHGPEGQCLYSEPLQRPDGTPIPVVYCTTEPEVAARLSDRQVSILLKPFDPDSLLAMVRPDDT